MKTNKKGLIDFWTLVLIIIIVIMTITIIFYIINSVRGGKYVSPEEKFCTDNGFLYISDGFVNYCLDVKNNIVVHKYLLNNDHNNKFYLEEVRK